MDTPVSGIGARDALPRGVYSRGIVDIPDDATKEIRSINMAYLIAARQMLRENYELAQFRLKLDPDVAKALMQMAVTKLEALADASEFVVRFAFTDANQLRTVAADKPEEGMVAMHAAVALSGIGQVPGMSS